MRLVSLPHAWDVPIMAGDSYRVKHLLAPLSRKPGGGLRFKMTLRWILLIEERKVKEYLIYNIVFFFSFHNSSRSFRPSKTGSSPYLSHIWCDLPLLTGTSKENITFWSATPRRKSEFLLLSFVVVVFCWFPVLKIIKAKILLFNLTNIFVEEY